ncbi:MATE family efflux transporter [Methanoculleus sp. Wushi-C6]|uniref:MATE family efflux transporter n=1 Tax=Methanoculleus caldifontis TaxID=2651577 RepID=A0ABU3X4B7_9EURY|nr:MATE family efflux transporter [Methanoculleus sp. Wushi-C6]MDV2482899.1 MATE family efflux transporter [Methanoculleus sp. Wushi-C6]
MSEITPLTSDPQSTERKDAITEGVAVLTGDPKRAVLKIAVPIMVAMLFQAVYNLADAVWVAGLGPDALAAVGFITPIFLIFIGLGSGLGAGVTSAASRRIGAGDKAGADSVAMHGIVIVLALSAVVTPALLFFIEPLVLALGAGETAAYAVEYGSIIFAGTVFLLFADILYAVFTAEGNTRRTMYAVAASAVLNIVLDPILIYGAGMGIAGAAWATLISMGAVCALLLSWFLVRKDTYIAIDWRRFIPEWRTTVDILAVGIPTSLEFVLMSAATIAINAILVHVAGPDAVAVYTGGWRIVFFALIPFIAMSIAVVSVAGAAYGGRKHEKLLVAHSFAVRAGILIGLSLSLATWFFAPAISWIFAYSADSAHLAGSITAFLMTMCFFYPFVSPGMISAGVFEGTGRGLFALALEFFRNLVATVAIVYFFAIVLDLGEAGVWWGIVVGNILGGIVGYGWARLYIARLIAVSRKATAAAA